ncbi:gamma-glutamylcyclotransferase [Vibrio sp. Of7-15]|uniref:gamma-glutamylcyclotransferase family protein n=1 Tax=Vibrio sp. Of7-15 TaxID=2724879 RepID=UPI001EF18CCE|nr:gamma-glutamylcyclotransferase family protein [Vibrio sp. Of7-15]MCG7496653.1 gamma-glutamylcyclotransferase [Vibrio sp. Of7-15]
MYIFGYGSLINTYSRQKTGQTGNSYPVSISGLTRHFGKIDSRYSISPLAAQQGKGECNGVLVEIDDIALAQFDLREKGYQRIIIEPEHITFLQAPVRLDSPVWAYVRPNPKIPCHDQPIVQSYIDTVLAGCLSISHDFAQTFINTTDGWQHALINDRENPIYGNLAGVQDHHRQQIDQLLKPVLSLS